MTRVLFVDDELLVRRVLPRLLRGTDYVVTVAASGEEAVATFQSQGPFEILVTDLRLLSGGMTGQELAEALRALQPSLKIVVVSGDPDDLDESIERLSPAWPLSKPFDRLELLAVLGLASLR